MRDITFVSPPFLGHLTQMLALAENLAARGHVVHVVTSHTREQEVREAGAKLFPGKSAMMARRWPPSGVTRRAPRPGQASASC